MSFVLFQSMYMGAGSVLATLSPSIPNFDFACQKIVLNTGKMCRGWFFEGGVTGVAKPCQRPCTSMLL
jgi:hypothetical protein